jgi:hypothetical protein
VPYLMRVHKGRAVNHYLPEPMFPIATARAWNARFEAAQGAAARAPSQSGSFAEWVLQESTAELGRIGTVPHDRVLRARDHWLARKSHQARDLQAVHAILQGQEGGTSFRTSTVWIGAVDPAHATMVPPPADRVARLIDDALPILVDARICPLLSALLFYTRLLHIHPYLDGNGRLARLVLLSHLQARGIPLRVGVAVLEQIAQGRGHEWLFENYNLCATEDWDPLLAYLLRACAIQG